MTGTAATMNIEENLALAKRRGGRRTLKSGITKKEREEYKELLKILDLAGNDAVVQGFYNALGLSSIRFFEENFINGIFEPKKIFEGVEIGR